MRPARTILIMQLSNSRIYNNELMKVSLAVSQGNFCEKYHVDFGPDWTVTFTK